MNELTRRDILGATVGAALLTPVGRAMATLSTEPEPLFLDASSPSAGGGAPFRFGSARRPDGRTLLADGQSLLLDGERWLPVMGEFHYTRYPAEEWAGELRKMKAGGIDVVASYVFWIHHEEVEGEWNWTGRRDLRAFVKACGEAGLTALVRCGPWAHGEVRNGGFPDWLLKKVARTRSDDPGYLAETKRLYAAIAAQLEGLLWKDGGPIIGIQCENEYGGPARHLLTLKRLAIEAGLDAPLYTKTAWPKLATPLPPGEFLPLSGAYAEGFWDRELTSMPSREYRDGFRFLLDPAATTGAIGSDQLGTNRAKAGETVRYPYLCCEIGGGMAVSYHRRVDVTPADVESTALCKTGSGNNLQGYYMYHGGTNPPGHLTTLQESQATAYWNDLTVKGYDFQAPLGEFGQARPHYHGLRRQSLFLRDWGTALAAQDARLPALAPKDAKDAATLRWSVRSDGRRGALFVNNYQRGQPMPAKRAVRFRVRLTDGEVTLPSRPFDVPADREFFWPLSLDLGGVELAWATAQPVCHVDDGEIRTVVFAAVPSVPTEFAFPSGVDILSAKGKRVESEGRIVVRAVPTGTDAAIRLRARYGGWSEVRIILLDDAASRTVYKATVAGRERLVLSAASLAFEDRGLRLMTEDGKAASVALLPAPARVSQDGKELAGVADGLFRRYRLDLKGTHTEAMLEKLREAGPARKVPMGSQGVAEAPTDADFASAAAWRIRLDRPESDVDLVLRLRYAGDVARFYLGDELLTDDFYNGRPFDLGLKRYGPAIYGKELRLEILPLGKDAPIFLPAKPDFGGADAIAKVLGLEVIERHDATLRIE